MRNYYKKNIPNNVCTTLHLLQFYIMNYINIFELRFQNVIHLIKG